VKSVPELVSVRQPECWMPDYKIELHWCAMIFRSKYFFFLLFTVFLCGLSAAADELKDVIKHQYKDKVIGLRTPFQKGVQEFDSAGKPLKNAAGGAWTTHGAMVVDDLTMEPDTLRIEGAQAAWGSIRDTKDNTVKDGFFPLKNHLEVVIHLEHPLTSTAEAVEVMDRVFLQRETDLEHLLPEYRLAKKSEPELPVTYKVEQGTVTPPIVVYNPDPEYSEEARSNKHEGMEILAVIVDESGHVVWIRLEQSLGMGLDEKIVDKVKDWRFKPARRDGHPVSVRVNIEVSMHLD